MNKYITKSIYLDYLRCSKNAWLKFHKKDELYGYFELSEYSEHLLQEARQVKELVRALFKEGILIDPFDSASFSSTLSYVQQKTPILYQPTFVLDKLYAQVDILEYDENAEAYNLYEIKSTLTIDENSQQVDDIEDISFQVYIMRSLGIKVGRTFIVHLNKEYIRGEEIDLVQLFNMNNDVTDKVKAREQKTENAILQAKTDLLEKKETDLVCNCGYKGSSAQCETFRYSHPLMPDYSVHLISRIGNSKKKLKELVDRNIFHINDVPDNFPLSEIQSLQIKVAKNHIPLIDKALIQQQLNTLKYPLYFLDYETFTPAIPRYKEYKPYKSVIFQFYLHVVHSENSKPQPYEYLHELDTDPTVSIVNKLRENIGDKGSIIVWHASFEKARNEELLTRYPDARAFLDGLNGRIYDLEKIFSNPKNIFPSQLYVHHEFRGSTALKNVLPVLAKPLSYDRLLVQDGVQAMAHWYKMVAGNLGFEEREKIKYDLKEYCKLDSYGMYAIWKYLIDVTNS